MSKSSQLLVIVFISTAQLALTLLAVAWLFGWIHERTQDLAYLKISETNRFIAAQMADRIRELELESIDPGSEELLRLQQFLSDNDLPDEGFLTVIDAQSGQILGHSELTASPSALTATWDEFIVDRDKRSLIQILDKTQLTGPRALLNVDHSLQVVHAKRLDNLKAYLLTHQRVSGLHAINGLFISSLRSFSFAVALILGLSGTILNIFLVRRIVSQDQKTQEELQEKVQQRSEELITTKNAIIFGLAKLAESRDNDTGEHLDRIRKYVTILAKDLKAVYSEIDDDYIYNLGIASSLHDIGKVGIPDAILLKPGRLTSMERSIMERHAEIGGECLEAIGKRLGENDFLEMAREVALWHHEQWDGQGYPHQLSDDEIPVAARIVAVADVYDALTSRRPYKRGMSHTESRAIIVSGSGQKFDPEVVAAFLRHEDEFQTIARRHQNVDRQPSTLESSLRELNTAAGHTSAPIESTTVDAV